MKTTPPRIVLAGVLCALAVGLTTPVQAQTCGVLEMTGGGKKITKNVVVNITSLVVSEVDIQGDFEFTMQHSAEEFDNGCPGSTSCLTKFATTNGYERLIVGSVLDGSSDDTFKLKMRLYNPTDRAWVRTVEQEVRNAPDAMLDDIPPLVGELLTGIRPKTAEEIVAEQEEADMSLDMDVDLLATDDAGLLGDDVDFDFGAGEDDLGILDLDMSEEEIRAKQEAERAAREEELLREREADERRREQERLAREEDERRARAADERRREEEQRAREEEDRRRRDEEEQLARDEERRRDEEERRREEEDRRRRAYAEEEEEDDEDLIVISDTDEILIGEDDEDDYDYDDYEDDYDDYEDDEGDYDYGRYDDEDDYYEDSDSDEYEYGSYDDEDDDGRSDDRRGGVTTSSARDRERDTRSTRALRDDLDSGRGSGSNATYKGGTDVAHVCIKASAGAVFYYQGFFSYGGDIGIHVHRNVLIDVQFKGWTASAIIDNDKKVVTLIPLAIGASYKGMRGRIHPFIGGDAVFVLYQVHPETGARFAPGFKVRGGVDFKMTESFGFFVAANLGFAHAAHITDIDHKRSPTQFLADIGGGIMIQL